MDESSVIEATILLPTTDTRTIVANDRRLYERRFPVYFVLLSTVFERLAFYSLAINLVVILKSDQLQWSASSSTTASFIFFGRDIHENDKRKKASSSRINLGASYLSSLIFAVISDAKLGRAKTIIIGKYTKKSACEHQRLFLSL